MINKLDTNHDPCDGEINAVVGASKIRESHVFRNTKLESKGRGNALTFSRLSLVSSLYARFNPFANHVIVWQIT